MKRLKVLFSFFLLLSSFPFWRWLDYLAISLPFYWPLSLGFTLWFAIFLATPLKLLIPKIKTFILVGLVIGFALIATNINPYSTKSSDDPTLNHCGSLTFTGFFYPLRIVLGEASKDDLESRNQMCWLRKLISEVPDTFNTEAETDLFTKKLEEKLLNPEMKYRSTLPLIAALYLTVNTSTKNVFRPKKVYDSLHLWISHYTDEISERDYSAWNIPISSYLKWEYGLIEKNWQKLIDHLVIEEKTI